MNRYDPVRAMFDMIASSPNVSPAFKAGMKQAQEEISDPTKRALIEMQADVIVLRTELQELIDGAYEMRGRDTFISGLIAICDRALARERNAR
jgi:hypothetical protein